MVKNLQGMLDEAVSKISELTEVLKNLNPDYDPELYYEEAAKRAMEVPGGGG